jgi:hypothetical protein
MYISKHAMHSCMHADLHVYTHYICVNVLSAHVADVYLLLYDCHSFEVHVFMYTTQICVYIFVSSKHVHMYMYMNQ